VSALLPLIGVTCCTRQDGVVFHQAKDAYVRAVTGTVGGIPVLIPSQGPDTPIAGTLAHLDGLIVTGSPSNVQPALYGGHPAPEGSPEDPARDATTLPLIRAAVAAGVPLLGICRGHQEINVAFGGTLFQRVHETGGHRDHRDPGDHLPLDRRYGEAHTVRLAPDGVLARLTGRAEIVVNSLHGQGIDRLAPSLAAEAWAEDGLIECVRVTAARTFAFGVQWHPEWRCADNPVSRALFAAFAEAARARALERARG
jgi:putative glutamine amidotransferase